MVFLQWGRKTIVGLEKGIGGLGCLICSSTVGSGCLRLQVGYSPWVPLEMSQVHSRLKWQQPKELNAPASGDASAFTKAPGWTQMPRGGARLTER